MKKIKSDVSRRDLLLRAGACLTGAAGLALFNSACGQTGLASGSTTTSSGAADSGSSSSSGGTTSSDTCSTIPSETAGPYPAHDDSSKNCLRFDGIVRSDIRSSLNVSGYTGTATAIGVPLSLTFELVSSSNCSPLSGYAIYLWHCDVNGNYSMYSSAVATQTYLRGVQATDANGTVTFKTIFPGCYDGRITHMHFEIYPSLNQAVDDYYAAKTSQLTFPMQTMNAVYNNVSSYGTSKTNLAKISYATDNIFSDGYSNQVATVSGSYSAGFVANLRVAI